MSSSSHQPARSRLSILGVPIDLRTRQEVDAWLRARLASADNDACRHLVTLNPEYVMAATRDAAFREAIRSADLVTPDGVGITLAVRWLSSADPTSGAFDRVTGVDITEMVAAISAQHGVPVYLLGAGPGVAETAAGKLRDRFPGFVLSGTWDGGTAQSEHDAESLERIHASGAKVVLVAYGAPGQIHWIARNQGALADAGVRLVVGVGGTFDFISGTVRRAPEWVRRIGFEWLYRLVREPWRWRRQLALPRFAWRVGLLGIQQRLRTRAHHPPDV